MEVDLGNIWLALFVPLIVSLVKQTGWSDRTNRIIAIAVYVVWAVAVTVAQIGFNLEDLPTWIVTFLNTFAVTITIGTVTYQLILKQFGIDDTLTSVTSVVKSPVVEEVIETEG